MLSIRSGGGNLPSSGNSGLPSVSGQQSGVSDAYSAGLSHYMPWGARVLLPWATPLGQDEHRAFKMVSHLDAHAFDRVRMQELRAQYASLYDAPLTRHENGSITFDKATLWRREGINVLHLKGDSFEMAFQHGRLLAKETREGTLPLMTRKIPNLFKGILGPDSRFYGLASWILNLLVHRRLIRNTPSRFLEEMFGVSEGAQVSYSRLLAATTALETVHILAKWAIQKAQSESQSCYTSCTSFAAWGDMTRDGKLVIGRNLDNPLNGYYDRHTTIAYFEPTDGSQKYVSMISAGVHTPSITSYNESGIFVSMHTVPTRETSPVAAMSLNLANEVVRRARTFDEAMALFKNASSPSGWAFLLVSSKENRAGSVEVTNKGVHIREANGESHVQTNHFGKSPAHERVMYVNRSVDADTYARSLRARKLLDDYAGGLDAKKAMTILADQLDPLHGVVRGLENTLGVHTTVGSVVLVPEDGKIYVANGMAPVSHNAYIEFPTPEKFSPETFASTAFEKIQNDEWKTSHPGQYQAVLAFIEAKKAFEQDKDLPRATELMKKVVENDASNSSYFFNLAMLCLKNGERLAALGALERILELGYPRQNVLLARYYRARIHADRGENREQVFADLDFVINDPEACAKMKNAAKKSRWYVSCFGKLALNPSGVGLMMQQADVENY